MVDVQLFVETNGRRVEFFLVLKVPNGFSVLCCRVTNGYVRAEQNWCKRDKKSASTGSVDKDGVRTGVNPSGIRKELKKGHLQTKRRTRKIWIKKRGKTEKEQWRKDATPNYSSHPGTSPTSQPANQSKSGEILVRCWLGWVRLAK